MAERRHQVIDEAAIERRADQAAEICLELIGRDIRVGGLLTEVLADVRALLDERRRAVQALAEAAPELAEIRSRAAASTDRWTEAHSRRWPGISADLVNTGESDRAALLGLLDLTALTVQQRDQRIADLTAHLVLVNAKRDELATVCVAAEQERDALRAKAGRCCETCIDQSCDRDAPRD